MITLKKAQEKGDLSKFVKEHRGDSKGDTVLFEGTIKKMAGKSRAVPKTSSADDRDD